MIVRGKHMDEKSEPRFNGLPVGFIVDPSSTKDVSYSDWVTKINDPYLNGGFTLSGPNTFGVKNLGKKNNAGCRGTWSSHGSRHGMRVLTGRIFRMSGT